MLEYEKQSRTMPAGLGEVRRLMPAGLGETRRLVLLLPDSAVPDCREMPIYEFCFSRSCPGKTKLINHSLE